MIDCRFGLALANIKNATKRRLHKSDDKRRLESGSRTKYDIQVVLGKETLQVTPKHAPPSLSL